MKRNKSIDWRRNESTALDLKGKKIVIIGGTGGIGRALSRLIALRGGQVTVVGQTFRDNDIQNIKFIKADLSLMTEAQRIGKMLPCEDVDMIVFTTGIFAAPKRQETAEGLEKDIAVSYLNRFVILREIGSRLGKNRSSLESRVRVFVMGYPGTGQVGNPIDLNSEKSYKTMAAHMNTVAANETLVLESAKYYPNINFYGLSPGLVKTNIRSNLLGEKSVKFKLLEWFLGLFTPTADDYASGIVPLLFSPDIEKHSGAMFDRKGFAVLPSEKLTDDAYAAQFTHASEKLIARTKVRL
jgi:NAD(P)-dependent dehydrogenase (short-subunit alcohol dehydrogenase family)